MGSTHAPREHLERVHHRNIERTKRTHPLETAAVGPRVAHAPDPGGDGPCLPAHRQGRRRDRPTAWRPRRPMTRVAGSATLLGLGFEQVPDLTLVSPPRERCETCI